MLEELLEAWRTNQRINRVLLGEIDDEGLACSLSARGGRDVARQFAHLHNNRVWQLEKRATDLAVGLTVFPPKTVPTKTQLRMALTASGKAVARFFRETAEGTPKRRGFRHGLPSALGYFVAHEAHHRGIVLATLKACGHPVPKDARYAIWGMWDQR